MCPVSLHTKHLSSFFNFSISSLLRRFFPKVEAEADEPREELVLAAAARWPAVWNVDGFLAAGFFSVSLMAQVARMLLSSLTKARQNPTKLAGGSIILSSLVRNGLQIAAFILYIFSLSDILSLAAGALHSPKNSLNFWLFFCYRLSSSWRAVDSGSGSSR